MSVKFRSIHAGEFHFIAYQETTGTTHTGTVYHDRVHANNSRDCKLFRQETYKFHHDHRSDSDTDIVMIALLYQFLYHSGNHSGMSVRTVICTWIVITGYRTHLILQDQQILILGTDDNIRINTMFFQPFYLRIYRCSTYTTAYKQDLLLFQALNIFFYKFRRTAKWSGKITERISFF